MQSQDRRTPKTPPIGRFVHSPIHRFKDRKSTRLNSSHSQISYAVFCLKKKKQQSKKLYGLNPLPPRTAFQQLSSPALLRKTASDYNDDVARWTSLVQSHP